MKKHRAFALSLLSTAAVMALIVSFSAQNAEASQGLSRHLADRLLGLLPVADPEAVLGLLNHILRKAAHFLLYLLLGFCLYPAAAQQRKFPPVALTVLIGLLFAATDEYHQCFSQGRTPSLLDVALDTGGCLSGTALGLLLHDRHKEEKER